MRKNYFLLIALLSIFWQNNVFAQLTGTRTIGTSGNYTTFAAAVTDLNMQGVGAGGVIFEFIDNGGGNFTETISAMQAINITTNAPTATNTVTFRPATSIGTATLTGSVANPIISLNNVADFITFDGRNGGTGVNKNLTIINTNTTNPVLRFINGANNNQILYTKIQSTNTGTTSGAVLFGTSTTGANTLNTIDNCEISGDGIGFPANGIYSSGSASPNNNTNNTVSNCFIYDYFVKVSATNGIFLSSNNSDWTINGNRFYQTATRDYTATTIHRAIQITTGGNYTINNNVIGFASNGETGTYTMSPDALTNIQFRCMSLTFSTGTSTIRGNRISDIIVSNTNSPNAFTGIEVLGGSANIGGTGIGEGNTIGNNTTTGNINITSTSNTGSITGILATSGATPIINIQGNKVGSIISNGGGAAVSNIIAIQTNSGGSVSNNTIGSTTVSNSINNVATTTSNNITVYGIFINSYTGTNAVNINDNIIANINNQHAGTSTTSLTRGIYSTGSMSGNLTINNNQIFNITTAATQNGNGYNNSALGGIGCNNAALITITGNQVYNLGQTGGTLATQIYGIFPNITNIITNIVSKNLIYDLSSGSTGAAAIYGLRMSGGGGAGNTCANNVIRLGQGVTAAHILYGLYDLGGVSNYYFNSVYITGTVATGSARSFAMANDATNVRRIRNNIFVNTRGNATSGANNHYAYFATTGGAGAIISDNNIVFANGTDGFPFGRGGSTGGTITNYTTYKNYRVDYPTLEVNSAVGNPQLVNPTAVVPDLSLALLSPAFQTGTSIGLITDDYTGIARNATPNIGAYETASSTADATTDIFTPTISYSLLSSPYATLTSTRTLTVTIKDNGTGVSTSGGNVPRLWYKNFSAGGASWQNVAGTLTSGTGKNGTWDFVLDQDILTLVAGQTVAYYVVAQDQATPINIWYNALELSILHNNVNTQAIEPITPNTYIFSGAMSGTYNIPNQFNSLTKPGGLFSAINNNTIGGNITVNITSDLTEDGVNGLNTWADAGNNYTLTIQPDASTLRTIQNSVNITTANLDMIRINTAVGVMIDGGTGKNLLFRNTNSTANNTGATIAFSNTASKLCTIQNVTMENNTNSVTEGNINILGGTNNVNINNCNIGDATAGLATGATRRAIYEATGTANVVNIQSNNIYNFLDNGVMLNSCANGAVISGNRFYKNITTNPNGTNVIAILNNGLHTISNNGIGGNASDNSGTYNFETNLTFTGIQVSGTNTSNTISDNTIKNITLSQSTSPKFIGVGTGTASQATISNLTIDNITIPSATSSPSIEGVRLDANSASVSNSSFTNLSMGTNNTGFFHVINCRQSSVTYNISNCTINNITSRTTGTGSPLPNRGFTGITALSGATLNVTGCTLSNMAANGGSELRAIYQTTASAVGTYTRNRIFGLTSSSGQIMGISANEGNFNTSHNQITITNALNTNNLTITGIYENTAGTKFGNHYFNTVYIGGTQTGGTVTSHCYRRDQQNSAVNLRNNLFINERLSSNGTGNNYVISATSTSFTNAWVSNYNLYIKGNNGNNLIGASNTGLSSHANYDLWKTAQTGEGNNSWNTTTGASSDSQTLNPTNLFVDLANGNLNINPANAEAWFVNGKGTQITGFADDFGATAVRSVTLVGGATDLGSDEIIPTSEPINANPSPVAPAVGMQTFTFAGRQVASINWVSGSLPSGVSVAKYYSGTNPSPNQNGVGMPGARYLNTYWKFEVAGGSGFVYDMTLNYDDAVLGLVQPAQETSNEIRLSKKDVGNNYWITYTTVNGGSTNNGSLNTITKTGLTSFSEFTGSTESQPLPVTLLSFTGNRQNENDVLLKWTTATETNNKGFEIEQSTNLQNFEKINFVDGVGNSTTIKNYELIVNNPNDSYYRLKQIDFNGSFSYSNIIFIKGSENSINVYPNPTTEKINITTSKANFNYKLTALQGNNLLEGNSISNTIIIDVSKLPKGLYLLNIIQNGKNVIKKIIIE